MKRLLVLGAGTAGTMVVNKLRPLLPGDEWEITIVDQEESHHDQPGYLFIPFGTYTPEEVIRPKEQFIPFEKKDGSMGTLYRHNGEYKVATRGSFYSDQAVGN